MSNGQAAVAEAPAQPGITWLKFDDLPNYSTSEGEFDWAGPTTSAVVEAPRLRLLHRRVELDYDPDERLTRKLIPAREDPEVL